MASRPAKVELAAAASSVWAAKSAPNAQEAGRSRAWPLGPESPIAISPNLSGSQGESGGGEGRGQMKTQTQIDPV